MPFTNGFLEDSSETDGSRRGAKQCFCALSSLVVRRPLSTFIFRSGSPAGRARFLIVDREQAPREEGLVLIATGNGLREARFGASTPRGRIWGTVVWILEEA